MASGGLGISTCCRSTSEGARRRASWRALIPAAEAVNGGKVGNGFVALGATGWMFSADAATPPINAPSARKSMILNIVLDAFEVV